MARGLALTIQSGSRWNWEEVSTVEDFEDLKLGDKYGFEVAWYTVAEKIHIVWRYVSGWETQIYVSDNHIEASEIFRELVSEQLEEVDEEDRNKMLEVLEKYGGASPRWLNR